MLRNLALLVASALVAKLLADAPLEETLAAFTRDRAVVSSCAKSRLHANFGQGKAGQGGAFAAMVRLASSGNREKWLEPVALATICHQQCRSAALLCC